jgi:hypothetical protein
MAGGAQRHPRTRNCEGPIPRTLPVLLLAPVPVISDAELTALLKACAGKDFNDRRDEALIRFLLDCGVRISEAAVYVSMILTDGARERVKIRGVMAAIDAELGNASRPWGKAGN